MSANSSFNSVINVYIKTQNADFFTRDMQSGEASLSYVNGSPDETRDRLKRAPDWIKNIVRESDQTGPQSSNNASQKPVYQAEKAHRALGLHEPVQDKCQSSSFVTAMICTLTVLVVCLICLLAWQMQSIQTIKKTFRKILQNTITTSRNFTDLQNHGA